MTTDTMLTGDQPGDHAEDDAAAPVRRPSAVGVVLAHHAVMGMAIAVPWLALAPTATRWGMPPVFLLLVLVGTVLPVLAWAALRRRLAAEGIVCAHGGDRTPLDGVTVPMNPVNPVDLRDRLGLRRPRARQVLVAGLPAMLVAVVLPLAGLPVEAAAHRWGWFATWPSTGVADLLAAPSASPVNLALVLGMWVVVAVVVGPVVEEVIFRGLLQPLLPGGPWARVMLGSALFAVYHLWQPSSWVTVWLATLPVAWVRERTGSTWLAAGVHIGVNAAALGMLLTGALVR
ncbi:CAAX protease self-immunity [Quadrisphaera granulorum]|uniref:CAAX prenyl protease-like protein n=1 Tax=Quadrisphaera granulorum TaxID=317664 RepID=A0A315ZQP7_9ACTN|nr:CPBP family intramembrane glutamic endopeptidase [Quadrisphaera granulorum]PWJ47602.1 CAAX prenyl protease-like protein [Quadrisphaera granulorum]SZE98732.1 CAAX protease self-immunity [Quadrisphaera granulorum]